MIYRRPYIKGEKGFSFVEMMVIVLLVSVIFTAGFILLMSGQFAWSMTDTKIHLKENLRQSLQRISNEVSETGKDSNNNMRVAILDNIGINGSDILRFAIPLCICGTSAIDANAQVKAWGAPLKWGQSGCQTNWTLNGNNKVTICHLPPGNPNNPQSLDVNLSAVNAHLAHGDWIGDCNACNPNNFNNRTVEYLLGANGQLLRQVLDANNNVINSAVVGQDITNFQASLNAQQNIVTLTFNLSKLALRNKTITLTGNMQVILRNYH